MRIILDRFQVNDVDTLTSEQCQATMACGSMYTVECLSGIKNLTFDGLGPNYETVRIFALNMKDFFEDCSNTSVEFTDLVREK